MSLLNAHKKRLEDEIIAAKEKVRAIKDCEFPDLAALKQLNEQIERNWQLIGMIDHHVDAGPNVLHKR